jgi:hypothetical protein
VNTIVAPDAESGQRDQHPESSRRRQAAEISDSLIACDFSLLAISAIFGFSAIRKRFARGRFIGAVCMIISILLLLRRLQEFL